MATPKKRISRNHEKIISTNIVFIKDNLEPNDILDQMIQQQIFGIEEADEIRVCNTRCSRVDCLIKKLLLIGDQFNTFIDILRLCKYEHVADGLEGTSKRESEHDEKNIQKSDANSSKTKRLPVEDFSPASESYNDVDGRILKDTDESQYLDVVYSSALGDKQMDEDSVRYSNLVDDTSANNNPKQKDSVVFPKESEQNLRGSGNDVRNHPGSKTGKVKKSKKIEIKRKQKTSWDYEMGEGVSTSPDHVYQHIQKDSDYEIPPGSSPDYDKVLYHEMKGNELSNVDTTINKSTIEENNSESNTEFDTEKGEVLRPVNKQEKPLYVNTLEEQYYDVANVIESEAGCLTKKEEVNRKPMHNKDTSGPKMTTPKTSEKTREAGGRAKQCDNWHTMELADYPGWDSNMTDDKIKHFADENLTTDGQYIIWYSKNKSTIIITVSTPHGEKQYVHYKLKQDNENDGTYYRVGDKSGFRDRSSRKVLDYVKKTGLPPSNKK